jgi:hypothetical protein
VTDIDRPALVASIRAAFAREYTHPGDDTNPGACLYWATTAIRTAAEHGPGRDGVRLVLQAGTAQFRRLPPHLDDGKPETSTHFSYMWAPAVLRHGIPHYTLPSGSLCPARPDGLITRPGPDGARLCLPEMHVWAADPERQEVVDLSTFALATQCAKVLGAPWLDAPPPDYMWCPYSALPDDWHYAPDRAATLLAYRLATAQGLL